VTAPASSCPWIGRGASGSASHPNQGTRHRDGAPVRGGGRSRHPQGLRRHRRPWATQHDREHKRTAAPALPEVDRSCPCTPLPASAVSSSSSTDPARPRRRSPVELFNALLTSPNRAPLRRIAGDHAGRRWPGLPRVVHTPRRALTTDNHVRAQVPQLRLASSRPGSAPFREDGPPAPGVQTTRSARRIGLLATHRDRPGRSPEAAGSHPRSKLGRVSRPATSHGSEVLESSGQEGLDAGLTSGYGPSNVSRVAPSGGESRSEERTRNLRTQQRA